MYYNWDWIDAVKAKDRPEQMVEMSKLRLDPVLWMIKVSDCRYFSVAASHLTLTIPARADRRRAKMSRFS